MEVLRSVVLNLGSQQRQFSASPRVLNQKKSSQDLSSLFAAPLVASLSDDKSEISPQGKDKEESVQQLLNTLLQDLDEAAGENFWNLVDSIISSGEGIGEHEKSQNQDYFRAGLVAKLKGALSDASSSNEGERSLEALEFVFDEIYPFDEQEQESKLNKSVVQEIFQRGKELAPESENID